MWLFFIDQKQRLHTKHSADLQNKPKMVLYVNSSSNVIVTATEINFSSPFFHLCTFDISKDFQFYFKSLIINIKSLYSKMKSNRTNDFFMLNLRMISFPNNFVVHSTVIEKSNQTCGEHQLNWIEWVSCGTAHADRGRK